MRCNRLIEKRFNNSLSFNPFREQLKKFKTNGWYKIEQGHTWTTAFGICLMCFGMENAVVTYLHKFVRTSYKDKKEIGQ